MNIFHKIAFQGLKKNRTRTLVTIIGVALSAALITAVSSFAVSLQSYVINGAAAKYGGWHVGFLNVSPSFVQEQKEDSRVSGAAAFENVGYAMLEGGENPDKPYLFIAGFDGETFDTLPLTLISGRLPENSGEILVPSHVATNGGVKISVGDTLTLDVGERKAGGEVLSQHDPYGYEEESLEIAAKKTYTVVGICQRPVFEEYSAPGYTLITVADAAGAETKYSVFVTLKKPRQVHAYAADTAGDGDYVLNDDVLRFMGLSGNQIFNTLLYSAGGIVMALIMLGSVFLIYNSFQISLNERMHQFGILLSVGATERQLRNSVLFEGICIGAAGIPLGILAGISGIRIVLLLVQKNFQNIMYDSTSLELVVSAPAIAAAAAVSLITILISAYLPAKKAASVSVMECIRQTNEVRAEAGDMRTPEFVQRIYGLEGTLALKNFKRSRRRYRSIVLSLTLSVLLFVSASAFRIDLNQIADQSLVDMDGDIILSIHNMKGDELTGLYDELKTAAYVTESTCLTAGGDRTDDSKDGSGTISDPGGGNEMPDMIFWSENPGQSAAQMKAMLEGAGITSGYTLYNVHEAFEQNRNILFIVNLFTGVFTLMMSLIAVANVFNTISTNIRLRRRELAMLRSVGMPDRDFNRMMCFECGFFGMRTLLLGLPAAGVLSWLIYKGMDLGGADIGFVFPWSSMAISITGVFLAISVTMMYAVSKIKKENIIEALRDDMT